MKQKTKKGPEEVKSRDGVIRRNLDRIRVSVATPRPSRQSKPIKAEQCEPARKKFLQEFTSLYRNRSGKRGIENKKDEKEEKARIRMHKENCKKKIRKKYEKNKEQRRRSSPLSTTPPTFSTLQLLQT